MNGPFATHRNGERAAQYQRAEARYSMFLQAAMRVLTDGRDILLRVRNLSAGGLMANATAPVACGERIEVNLRGIGPVPGRVAWSEGERFGVAFEKPIDPTLARKPVGTHATETMIIKRPSTKSLRRPGLRIA